MKRVSLIPIFTLNMGNRDMENQLRGRSFNIETRWYMMGKRIGGLGNLSLLNRGRRGTQIQKIQDARGVLKREKPGPAFLNSKGRQYAKDTSGLNT